ncbi:dihydroorotate dehydrogenase [Metallosphaera tengchongensis]|uniref:Dihydroorotate dehydrogenase n=1 Tax=Metallosphaera tengchongensis TaxID=1532350 RepID=A0A6N0NS67_9CREN|nr:dihydroorotate dehydrogenase PyrD [Metallosphaera tengchongensis]QKQ99551.1 dihydroorotate dehydrogenase [Metallosphaera tengchongensis]
MYSIRLSGIELRDPFVIASGIVPDVPEYMARVCQEFSPSAITTKTFTLNPLEPHKPPTLVKISDGCFLNAIGLGNPGIKVMGSMEVPCNLFVSVGGSSLEEIVETAIIGEGKASLIEINLSSPNRRGYGADTAKFVREIVKEVKGKVRKPIFVKLGPWDNVVDLAGKALEGGADGLTLINTVKGMKLDVDAGKPVLSYGTGGVSGRCIHPLAVRVIGEVYSEYSAQIIGTGGVFSWEDAMELFLAGATAVGVGSAILERGFEVLNELRVGLTAFMEEKGINLSDVIGMAVRK